MTPGPLTLLVMNQTLRFGIKEGLKSGIAPILTDVPIILLCTGVLSRFSRTHWVIGLISLAGAVFLARMAADTWRAPAPSPATEDVKPQSVLRGVATNLLNPHPYLFWLTIGAPLIVSSDTHPFASAVAFAVPMLSAMVGSKILLALTAKALGTRLGTGRIQLAFKSSAVILWCFAAGFGITAIKNLGAQFQ